MKFTKFSTAKVAIASLIGVSALTAGVFAYNDQLDRVSFEEQQTLLDGLSLYTAPFANTSIISARVSGVVPEAEVKIFVDGLPSDVLVDAQVGEFPDAATNSFDVKIALPNTDGVHTLTAEQTIRYKSSEATGDQTEAMEITLDTAAPTGSISVWPTPPSYSNATSLTIYATIKTADKDAVLHITNNGYAVASEESDDGSIEIRTSAGNNELAFSLIDPAGNQSNALYEKLVLVDTTAPVVKNTGSYFCGNSSDAQELVCLSVGEFSGPLW